MAYGRRYTSYGKRTPGRRKKASYGGRKKAYGRKYMKRRTAKTVRRIYRAVRRQRHTDYRFAHHTIVDTTSAATDALDDPLQTIKFYVSAPMNQAELTSIASNQTINCPHLGPLDSNRIGATITDSNITVKFSWTFPFGEDGSNNVSLTEYSAGSRAAGQLMLVKMAHGQSSTPLEYGILFKGNDPEGSTTHVYNSWAHNSPFRNKDHVSRFKILAKKELYMTSGNSHAHDHPVGGSGTFNVKIPVTKFQHLTAPPSGVEGNGYGDAAIRTNQLVMVYRPYPIRYSGNYPDGTPTGVEQEAKFGRMAYYPISIVAQARHEFTP